MPLIYIHPCYLHTNDVVLIFLCALLPFSPFFLLPRLTQCPLCPPLPPQIKTYLQGSHPMDGPFNFVYTACLCENYSRTFFWDFEVNSKYRGHPRKELSTRARETVKRNVTSDVGQNVRTEGWRERREEEETVDGDYAHV